MVAAEATTASAESVRARIARTGDPAIPSRLGSITLRPHQSAVAARAARRLRVWGGALVAEDVGRGKTFIALALAASSPCPVVVLPAAMRSTWAEAMRRADVACSVVTHEGLSRGAALPAGATMIIVDESHHFRNADARRYARLASFLLGAPLLLLSATPLQNGERDLRAQLALFLGERAWLASLTALSAHVVRGAGGGDALPLVTPPEWLRIEGVDDAVLEAILALPPPALALDTGDAGVLRAWSLIRAWGSSRAALRGALQARQRVLAALEQCLAAGRLPTRGELLAWSGGSDVQLGFAELLAQSVIASDALQATGARLRAEQRATRDLARMLDTGADPDAERARLLRGVLGEANGGAVVAFSEHARTIVSLWRALARVPGVAMLTSREGHIASGRVARDELLALFAPVAQGVAPPPAHARVRLLLTTDLLSEGVNLQDAGTVVHLDLPWNPARLAQRVGRVRRPGGASSVRTLLMAPPASAAALLRAEDRLRGKMAFAQQVIAPGFAVLPTSSAEARRRAPGDEGEQLADREGALEAIFARWRDGAVDPGANGERCIVAAARAPDPGWLAALGDGTLLAGVAAHVSDDRRAILAAARHADRTAERALRAAERDEASAALARWIARRAALESCGTSVEGEVGGAGELRGLVERRISAVLARSYRHERAAVAASAARLRLAMTHSLPAGTERAITMILHDSGASGTRERGWIDEAVALAERALRARAPAVAQPAPRVVALLLFGP